MMNRELGLKQTLYWGFYLPSPGAESRRSHLCGRGSAVITPRRSPYMVRDVSGRRFHSLKTDRPESPRRFKCVRGSSLIRLGANRLIV